MRPHPALATSERFRRIAELGGDLAFVLDCATGKLDYLSEGIEALLGYTVEQAQGQLDAGAGALGPLMQGLAERRRRFESGDASRCKVVREIDLRHRDGASVAVEIVSSLYVDDSGTVLLGLVRDLRPLRQVQQDQKRFASMINHEFRTPLATIDGAIQRLEVTGKHTDEPTRLRYRKIQSAVDRLIGMLNDYLSPERMASIGRVRQPDAIAPQSLLDAGAARLRAGGRPVTVLASTLPASVRCDPAGINLAFNVLLDNVLKYTPAGSCVTLCGRPAPEGGMEVLVSDNGDGIPDKEVVRVFDKFFRGQNAAGIDGSGLGLYMARSVVEVHGGTLTALRGENGGCSMRLWLPAHQIAGKNIASESISSDNSDGQQTRVGAELPEPERKAL